MEFPRKVNPRAFLYRTIVLKDVYLHTTDEHNVGY